MSVPESIPPTMSKKKMMRGSVVQSELKNELFRFGKVEMKGDLKVLNSQCKEAVWSLGLFPRNPNALDEPTDRPRQGCNANTSTPLPPIKPHSLSKLLQKLHHYQLKHYSNPNYC